MAEVVAIRPDLSTAGNPIEKVILLLEEALAQARSGNLRAVGIACVYEGYAFNAQFALDGPHYAALIGAGALLGRRLTDDCDDFDCR
jgi:hypothetical protein